MALKIFRKADNLTQDEIHDWLVSLRGNPYVPGSGFDVTSVMKAKIGGESFYFAGVNAENIDQRLSTHGEEGAIAAMVTALGKYAEITEGWVLAAPRGMKPESDDPLADGACPCCGNCRQRIAGFADADVEIHSLSLSKKNSNSLSVKELLPLSFSFRDFAPELIAGDQRVKTLLVPDIKTFEQNLVRQGKDLSVKDMFNWLSSLEGADFASKISHSVVVRLDNGAYVAGVNVEDAAYTGTNAVQSAMAIATAEFGSCAVTDVWSFAKGRDEKVLPNNGIVPLPLSALQTLNEFAVGPNVPLTMFTAGGEEFSIVLRDAARGMVPTFKQPYLRLQNGALIP